MSGRRIRFTARSPVDVTPDELYRWHVRPGALTRLTPAWAGVRRVEDAPMAEGEKAILHLGLGPIRLRWVARREDFVEGEQFVDEQESGPFAHWRHTHRMLPGDEGGSVLEDCVELEPPFGFLGRALGGPFVRKKLERLFRFRHRTTRADLERHRTSGGRKLVVVVSGSSGLVGTALCAFLEGGGHEVRRLVRRNPANGREFRWDPAGREIGQAAFENADALIHLGGVNIAEGRWSAARKRRIRDSRVDSTGFLAKTLTELERPPAVWVNASAIGYYGDRGDEALDETALPGAGFLAETCREWEDASRPAANVGVRVVSLRIGPVIAAGGGMLPRVVPPFLMGLGGRLGSGKQYLSWIGADDLVGAIHHALLCGELRGPVNAVAPDAVSNLEWTHTLGRILRRPTLLPAPAFAIRAVLGQMGQELLLEGARVRPGKLLQSGFRFEHPDLEGALRFELGRFESAPPPDLRWEPGPR